MSGIVTMRELQRRTGAPYSRLHYAIRTRGIAEAGRVGNSRYFTEAAARRVELALLDTASRRKERSR